MAKLTPEQVQMSHSWLYDIFVLCGAIQPNVKARHSYYYKNAPFTDQSVKNNATALYNAFLMRKVTYKDFEAYNKLLEFFADVPFQTSLDADNRNMARKPKDMLAKYVANLCAEHKWYWDSSAASKYEMDEIKQTPLGIALWDNYLFTTEEDPVSGQPQNHYKSLGPLSGNVPNLIGQPNQKIDLTQYSYLYCIEADKIGKNTPNIFITPVDTNTGASRGAKASETNLGSGNSYPDCKLFFTDSQDASNFLTPCQTKFAGSKFQNLHVAKVRPDKKGYFKVSTEFGEAYIKANNLNEEVLRWLAECANQNQIIENKAARKKVKYTNAYTIQDIDAFDESFTKYRD